MKQNSTLHITWQEVDHLVDSIVTQIKEYNSGLLRENCQLSSIYGIPRGGLVLAVMLSHRLGLEMVAEPTESSLIVDDIADTGKTLKGYDLPTAVLIAKPYTSIITPNFVGKFHYDDRWVIFPWEDQKISHIVRTSMDSDVVTLDKLHILPFLTYWQMSKLGSEQLDYLTERVSSYINTRLNSTLPSDSELRSITQAIASNVLGARENLDNWI